MPFQIVHNDITKMNTDAIVNAANSKLIMGGGVCGAIYKAAGEIKLKEEIKKIGCCAVGDAVITKGYNLKAKYIIHAVGPVYKDGNSNEAEYLKSAYKKSLQLAKDNGLESISFPLISSGIYGYPKAEALNIAIDTITEFLIDNEMDIYLVVFDRKTVNISENLYNDISHYIDSYYEDDEDILYDRRSIHLDEFIQMDVCESMLVEPKLYSPKERSIEDILDNIGESFSQMVLRLIDEKGKTDVEVYKKANMDRKLFSKIRSKKDYTPKKATAVSLAIALELSLDETKDLLGKAGFTLSRSQKGDLIIQYFIEKRDYDIHKINESLFEFEQPLLVKS